MTEPEADELGLGRVTRVDPRTVWKHEAQNLTPWILQHLDLLADALGTEIIPSQREVRVGQFSLDVLGEDASGRAVIVENQLEQTNHTHLGQLLVYASGLEAALVVWLTPSFREEHRQALDWLNERTDETVHFFGVEIDLVRVGNSRPAPIFRVVARPNDWQKAVRRQASAVSSVQSSRHDFFQDVIDDIGAAHPTFNKPKVGYDNWVSMSSGPFGYYALSFAAGDRVRAEAYLDTGNRDSTKRLFDMLSERRDELETQLGVFVEWERLDNKRASRIAVYRSAPQFEDPGQVAEVRRWSVESLLAFMRLDPMLRQEAVDAKSNNEGGFR